jgi:26S proteasome regulatory subunit (ATPase 3-interacting protein)
LILTYLRRQPSRPYSAVDISANLKNRVTKTSAAKILKDLHERGEIAGCTQGKQSVYHALQVRNPLSLFFIFLSLSSFFSSDDCLKKEKK